MAPSVDILIVSYNTRDVLRACLRSIDAHRPSSERIELIVTVLDNASHDGSAEMVETEFPTAKLVRSGDNVGFSKAHRGLAMSSRATYVMLLNSDTVLRCDVVTPLLAALEEDPAIAIVGPRLVGSDGQLQTSSERFPTLSFELARLLRGTKAQRVLAPIFDVETILARVRQADLADHRESRDTDFLWATCWLMRNVDVAALDLFADESFVTYDEDLDFCRSVASAGRRIVYVPSVTIVHLGGSSSTAESKRQLMRAGRVRYYQRHHGWWTASCYRILTWAAGLVKARSDA